MCIQRRVHVMMYQTLTAFAILEDSRIPGASSAVSICYEIYQTFSAFLQLNLPRAYICKHRKPPPPSQGWSITIKTCVRPHPRQP